MNIKHKTDNHDEDVTHEGFYQDEEILSDDYPVYAGYLYFVDGKVRESNVTGTVRYMKADFSHWDKHPVKEVRRYSLGKRIDGFR